MIKVKTCLVTGQYPPQVGGVGHSAYRIANMLASHGFEVHVVAFQKHPEPLPLDDSIAMSQEEAVRVHRVKVYNEGLRPDCAHSESEVLTRYNREMFQALDYLQRRHDFDVLHAFFLYPAGYVAGLVGRLHRKRVIASIRGNDVGKYVFDPIRMPMVRSALENADYVTSVATNLIELADRAVTPIASKSRTILNSINFDRLKVHAKPDLALHGLVIGTAGLFRYKKGLVYLLNALGRLNGEFDYTVLLAGDFFKEEDRLPHLGYIASNRLEQKTIITGKIASDRMADYLQLFDILVFPSLYSEGCPLSMLEAMAMKKAVIGTRAGAIPEIIRHGENGLLVNSGSSAEIMQAIRQLASAPSLREKLGENAEKSVRDRTMEKEYSDWLNVYEHVLRDRAGERP